jgi:hypothetical protein
MVVFIQGQSLFGSTSGKGEFVDGDKSPDFKPWVLEKLGITDVCTRQAPVCRIRDATADCAITVAR